MIQNIKALQYINVDSTLAITFAILTIWAAVQRLKNKRVSTLFLSILITSSITLCVITFYNERANDQRYISQKSKEISVADNNIVVAFSPKQGATLLILNTIENAKESILVAAYSFTSKPITAALIKATLLLKQLTRSGFPDLSSHFDFDGSRHTKGCHFIKNNASHA